MQLFCEYPLRCFKFWSAAIVSFGNVSSSQKKEAEAANVSCFSWEEFAQLVQVPCEPDFPLSETN